MQRLEQAVVGLEQALSSIPQLPDSWCPLVRQRLARVRDALAAESTQATETWLSARAGHLHRERIRLLSRIAALGGLINTNANALDDTVRENLLRLVHDIQHHHQRVNDLAYDSVAMEVGGSE